MFEFASREKLRFAYKGTISVEDLWEIPLEALDEIYKTLNRSVKAQTEDSLLDKKTSENKLLETKIAIVKHVVSVRLAEQKERETEKDRADRKQIILSIIAEKQNADLRNKSVDELIGLVNSL